MNGENEDCRLMAQDVERTMIHVFTILFSTMFSPQQFSQVPPISKTRFSKTKRANPPARVSFFLHNLPPRQGGEEGGEGGGGLPVFGEPPKH